MRQDGNNMKIKTGKIPHQLMGQLLKRFSPTDPDVLVGPGIGLDSAVVRLGEDDYLVIASDPITFVAEEIGFYLVTVNANDIAATGAKPEYLIVDLLFPEADTDYNLVDSVFGQIARAAEAQGISVIGGHTEVTYGLDRVIAIGTMIGRIRGRKLITAAGMRKGDLIVLTKGIAIEGTAILAKEKKEALKDLIDENLLMRASKFLFDPGISVVKEALTASDIPGVHAMHDPTEGGLATAVHEMAIASGTGVLLFYEKINVYPETLAICEALGLDPLGLIASGALLIAVAPENADELMESISGTGIQAEIIGEVKDSDFGVKIERNGRLYDLPLFSQDEITKAL